MYVTHVPSFPNKDLDENVQELQTQCANASWQHLPGFDITLGKVAQLMSFQEFPEFKKNTVIRLVINVKLETKSS